MGIKNSKKQQLKRLESKTIDNQFLQIIQKGLGYSPFESKGVLDAVKEVYFPFFNNDPENMQPGKVSLVAVCADEPAGKPIANCEKKCVCLTVHAEAEDDRLLQEKGPVAFRQARIPRLCQEALSKGVLLNCEDLAHHIFFVTTRTISRDLAALRKNNPSLPIPLRSTVHDIGPVLTHRVKIVKLALEGKTTTQICNSTHHSPAAVSNYLSTFVRCAHLEKNKMEVGQIAFLLKRGKGLIQKYLDLLAECKNDKNMKYHLAEMRRIGNLAGKKTRPGDDSNGQ